MNDVLTQKKMSLFLAKPLLLLVLFFTILVSFSNNTHAAALQKPPTNLNLVAYWSFDDATSTVASDISGNGNQGTLNTFSTAFNNGTSGWTYGKRGRALQFDGSSDYVSVVDSSTLRITGDMAISAWVLSDSNGGGRYVIEKGSNDNDNYAFYLQTGGVPNFEFEDNTNTYRNFVSSNATVPVGVWTHIAVVYDDTNNTISFYKNGSFASSQATTFSLKGTQTNDVWIGRQNAGTASYFDGNLDDIRLYNRALTGSEINSIYKSSQLTRPAPNETGLISYWPFNEGTSTSATDFSNNGNTGTFTPSTGWTNGGKFGSAVTFGETVQMTTTNQYSNPTVFTISAWFNSTNPSGKKIIGFESNQTGNSSTSYDRHLYLGSDGKVYFGWFPGFVATVSSSATYVDGKWHHVVGTHDGTTGTLYVDGVSQGSSAAGAPQSYSGYWRVGGRKLTTWTNGSDGNFIGKIDDVRIYSKTLSALEVSALYKGSKTRFINSSQATRLSNGLIGLWTFDGRDVDWGKNIIYDRSGNNLYGTTTGLSTTTTPISGKVGQAFRFFNTTNNYIDLGNNALLAPTSAMTVSAWINTNNCNVSRYILSKGDTVSYYFRIQASTCKLRFQTTTSGSGTVTLDSANNAIQNNTWHHVSGTWDGSNMRLYVDGTLSAGPTAQIGTLATPGTNVQIGGATTLATSWDGALDEIRLYNRALDASEIKQLYLMGK